MPVKFVCNECRQLLSISRRKIGSAIDCPRCGRSVDVPDEAEAEAVIADLRERKERKRLKRNLKFPDLAVYDEQPGASAAEPSSLSDPRTGSRRHRRAEKKVATPAVASTPSGDRYKSEFFDANFEIDDSPDDDGDWTENGSVDPAATATAPPEAVPAIRTASAGSGPVIVETLPAAAPQAEVAARIVEVAVARTESDTSDRLEKHRRTRDRNARLAKAVAIMAFGALLFVAGWFAGRSGKSLSELGNESFKVSGGVLYTRANGETAGDNGAVVIALPVDTFPANTVDVRGLGPSAASPGANHAGILAIEELGGAYARADATGEFQLELPVGGKYIVLMISAHTSQSNAERITVEDDALLSRYFSSGAGLVGSQRYKLQTNELNAAAGRVSHLFQVGG